MKGLGNECWFTCEMGCWSVCSLGVNKINFKCNWFYKIDFEVIYVGMFYYKIKLKIKFIIKFWIEYRNCLKHIKIYLKLIIDSKSIFHRESNNKKCQNGWWRIIFLKNLSFGDKI